MQSGSFITGTAGLQPKNGEGLDAQLGAHIDRLAALKMRLGGIGDALHGLEPPVGGTGSAATPGPPPSIASRVRTLGDLVGAIENAVSRIQGGL